MGQIEFALTTPATAVGLSALSGVIPRIFATFVASIGRLRAGLNLDAVADRRAQPHRRSNRRASTKPVSEDASTTRVAAGGPRRHRHDYASGSQDVIGADVGDVSSSALFERLFER